MRVAVLFLIAILTCSFSPKGDDDVRCKIHLKNGSIFVGTIEPLTNVHLKTKYAVLKIPSRDLCIVRWGDVKKEEKDRVYTKSGSYDGWIEKMKPVKIESGFGTLTIPVNEIRSMRVWREDDAIREDFDNGISSNWKTYGSQWKNSQGELISHPKGNTYDEIMMYQEKLEAPYTVEVDIQADQQAGILIHAKDQRQATGVWLNRGNTWIGGGNGSVWYSNTAANWTHALTSTELHHVRVEVEERELTVYIDGKKVGTVAQTRNEGKVGLFCFSGSARFDNFQILN